MFNNVGIGELIVLFLVGIVVVGPERLPKLIADAGRLFRQLRRMALEASADLRENIGVDDLAGLHPRALAREFLMGDGELDGEDPNAPAKGNPYERLAPGEPPPFDQEAT